MLKTLHQHAHVLCRRAHAARRRSVHPHRPMATGAARTALAEVDKSGAFVRTAAGFRNQVEPGGRFAPEAGRYVLVVSYACPWACRCLSALYLKGLEDAVALSVVHPTWQRTRPGTEGDAHTGWMFRAPGDPPLSSTTGHGEFGCADCVPFPGDAGGPFTFVRDVYEAAHDTTGKYSVPILWDTKEGTIVNNESSEIMRMFNGAFNHLAKRPQLDLYPEDLRAAIDELNDWIYPTINNGVYRCGFATKQAPYEQAYKELFASLERVEAILAKQRYLAGSRLTEADVRLFQTLIRFDTVYVVYFKTNGRCIREYPATSNWVRDMYQTPGIKHAVNMNHIKTHYFTSHPLLNTYAIVPLGPLVNWWEEPHDRAALFPDAKQEWDP